MFRLSPRLFQLENGCIKKESEETIIEQCLVLLGKMIDYSDSFHITLLGISVSDFLEQVEKKGSIKNFFISPKKDGIPQSVPTELQKPKKNLFKDETESTSKRKPCLEKEDGSKRKKIDDEIKDKNANLLEHFSSKERDPAPPSSNADLTTTCPGEYDPEVWRNLPQNIKQEILQGSTNSQSKEIKNNSDLSSKLKHKPGDHVCPKGYDPEVFCQLPEEIRNELTSSGSADMKTKKPTSTPQTKPSSTGRKKGTASKPKEKNSILKYFTRS